MLAWLWDQQKPDRAGISAANSACGINTLNNRTSKTLLNFTKLGPYMQHLPYQRARGYHKRPFAYIWPTNGQTAENRAKPSPPSHSPLDLGLGKKFLWPNGLSRRTRLSHKTLPRQAGVRVASDAGHMPVARAPPVGLPISYTSSVAPPSQMRWSPPS